MAEEHRCQAPPEGHRLCANNCGFFGSPATLNLCSKCYSDFRLKEEQASSAKIAVEKSLIVSSYTSGSSSSSSTLILPKKSTEAVVLETPAPVKSVESEAPPPPPSQQPSRCNACKKRVGLTGFRCRCGETFCGTHRYPEQHKCSFDFKSVGKEDIARANPVVKAQKLDKI